MKQNSNMEVDSTLPGCVEKEVGISDVLKTEGNVQEFSSEHEGERKETASSAVQEDIKMKEAVVKVVNTSEAGKFDDKCIVEGSRKKKTVKVLKVKRKIIKKTPASSVTKKALTKQEDDKREKEALIVQKVGETVEAQNPKKEKDVSIAQEVAKTPETQNPKKEKDVSIAQEVAKTPETQNPIENFSKPVENSSKPASKTKKVTKVLKVKRKIAKKSPASSEMKTNNKLQRNPKVQTRNRRENNKSALQAKKEDSENKVEDTEKPNQKVNVNRRISKEQCVEKGKKTSASHKNNLESKSSIKERKNTEKVGSSSHKSITNQKKEEKDIEQKSPIEDKNEENLGGLIFLCSSKTKPDCFHYNVMGVPAGKKDAVLAIKPGLSLFLYDFDLRLLHGIYKASSSGGMSLEPKAFNGAFPAQVRFSVHKDCFPLPESIFKKAIEENYYEKRKFKTELTVKQVRKLSVLFRPVWLHPSSATDRSQPEVPIRDKKVHEKVKDTRTGSSKSKGDVRNDRLSYHGRDRPREEAPRQRDEVPRDLFLSEKDYRTYGLRAERRNLDPVPRSYLETYNKDRERDYRLRHLEPSSQREVVRSDHVYFNGKDYPIYSVDSRSQISPPRAIPGSSLERTAYDSIYTRQYGLSSIDPYLLPSRREEAAAPSTYSRNYGVDNEPMRHAAGALSSYNQVHPKDGERDTMPVSARYTFSGPSFSYR